MVRILNFKLNVSDNSGITKIMALRVLGSKNKVLRIGDILSVLAKKWRHRRKLKKKQFCLAVVISLNRWLQKNDGSLIRVFSNKVVLYNIVYKKLWSKILGIVNIDLQKVKSKKFKEILKQILYISKCNI
jgi:ribosomal protein L14